MRDLTGTSFASVIVNTIVILTIRPWFSSLKHGETHPENLTGCQLVACTNIFLFYFNLSFENIIYLLLLFFNLYEK